ncbi:MAG: hypothetical protein AAFP78_00570, partial [Pseudomonadota bacterium]
MAASRSDRAFSTIQCARREEASLETDLFCRNMEARIIYVNQIFEMIERAVAPKFGRKVGEMTLER